MRCAFAIIGILLAATVAAAAPVPPAAKATADEEELKKFEGVWTLESVLARGMKIEVQGEVEFKKDLVISRVKGAEVVWSRMKLDVSAKPRRMTAITIEEPAGGADKPKGGANNGCVVYKLDGDALTIVGRADNASGKFPESLDDTGAETVIMVLKRKK